MESKIAKAIKLRGEPVAIWRAGAAPEGALTLTPGKWGCTVALLSAASRGRTAAASLETTVCRGGRAGLGLGKDETGEIEYFLSTGGRGPRPGERYKQSPELALEFIRGLPEAPSSCTVFAPLSRAEEGRPEAVVFLVNADQLSALVTLANFDRAGQDGVRVLFGAGCTQCVLYPLAEQARGGDACFIGLTDPSARKCVSADLLAFAAPYGRFLAMEANADESFLHTETWEIISKRI